MNLSPAMRNQVWKTTLSVGLIALASTGAVISGVPFERFRSVAAQGMRQDAEQAIPGRLSEDSETLDDGSYFNVYVFKAEAGQTFLIEMVSDEFDTYLMVFDAEGNKLAENNDSENGTNAQILVTIPATGLYTIIANSFQAGETGDYTLTIQATQTEAISQEQNLSNATAEANHLFQQGLQQYQMGQFREALASLGAALEISREINNRQGETNTLGNLGNVHFSLGQYETAIDYYEQSLAISREIGYHQGEANALGNLGNVHFSLGQYETAIDYHERSLAISREIDDRQGEAISLQNLGSTYRSIGQYETAIGYHERSLAINREIGNRQGEASSLSNLGNTYRSIGQYETAIDYHEQSLAISREIGYRQGEANALGGLGNAYLGLGQYETAIDYHEQSLDIDREVGDRQGEEASLGGLGNAYYLLGQYEVAIDYHEQSLAIAREIGDRQGEANSLGNLGNAYLGLGQYEIAIDYHEQYFAISHETGDRQGEATALGNLGIDYRSLGDYLRSIDYHEQSLALSHEIGDRQGEANALANLGIAYDSIGKYRTAIDYHKQSLAIALEIGNRQVEAASLGSLGITYWRLGEYRTAIDYHKQSLAIDREIGDRQGEANSLGNLGLAYLGLGQYETAIDYHEQHLAISREIGDRQGEAISLSNLGLTYLSTQQYETAETLLLSAIEVLEALRTSDLPDPNKVSLFETQRNSYELLQQALVAQNKNNLALEIAERSRARALIELIATQVSVRTAEEVAVTIPSLAEIQQIAQQQNDTFVSYSIINPEDINNSVLYIWIIPPTGEISFEQIDLTTLDQPLSELVTVSRSTIGARSRNNNATIVASLSPEAKQQQQQSLKQLYDILIAPIADKLPIDESDRVIFIPQGELFLVPFAALIDKNDQYLIENHTISISPSIQALALTNQLSNPNASLTANPLIVGNPTMPKLWNPDTNTEVDLISLPGAENEAMAIAQQLNTDALLHDNASETIVAERMQTASLIHLATHGLLDYGTPEESGIRDVPGAIALAPDSTNDGLLTSAEIFAMQLQAELVVLSACDTGRGTITSDGVIGLSRSLMQAGVPSVVVSLWSVPDDSTEFLMKEFYTNLEEMDKVQALRQAMLTTMENPEHTEPLDWAAFTLVGEPE